MRTIFVSVLVFIGSIASAQRTCLTSAYLKQQELSDPGLSGRFSRIESFLKSAGEQEIASRIQGSITGEMVIRIPVVVHVVYHTPSQNITDAQIKSQLAALNRDFRRMNADSAKTPSQFKGIAADVKIEFELATADPDGRPTTGIIRKQTSVVQFEMNDRIKSSAQGGSNPWDTRSYLNIWVCPLYRLLGYAALPGSDAAVDGVVINTSIFGTINIGGPYNLGRTGTHEVGHWLGLRHIWGDDYCGDDLVHDTPKQGNFTVGCPTAFRSSCDNSSTGDMYMNYMDFTDDACMNLFTNGQKARMRSMFLVGGPRAMLISSKGLNEPWNFTQAPPAPKPFVHADLKMYPNPAQEEITLNFEHDTTWIGKEVRILNANGILLKRTIITKNLQKVNISEFKGGIYFALAENGERKLRAKLVKL